LVQIKAYSQGGRGLLFSGAVSNDLPQTTKHGEQSRSSWKHGPEKLKGEGNGNSSNQEKVRGLNKISKIVGLVKDKDLTPLHYGGSLS